MQKRLLLKPLLLLALGLASLSSLTAHAESVVNLYTTREKTLIEPILATFTAKTGITVRSVFVKNGLIERLEAEGKQSPADVVLLVDVGELSQLASKSLTQTLPEIAEEKLLPQALRDPKRQWLALSARARVAYVHKDLPITKITYAELAEPKWKGKVCIRSGQHPYNTGLFAAMLAHQGEGNTKAWLSGVKQNLARKATGGDRDVARDILGGICDIGLANSYYVGQMRTNPQQKAWGESIRVLIPTFANGKTHVNISGIALAKNAPHTDEAKALIEFMLSKEAQEFYAKANFEYPVRSDVPIDPMVARWGKLNMDDLPINQIAKNRSTASKLVDETGFDQ